jgi:hypothetical protein
VKDLLVIQVTLTALFGQNVPLAVTIPMFGGETIAEMLQRREIDKLISKLEREVGGSIRSLGSVVDCSHDERMASHSVPLKGIDGPNG